MKSATICCGLNHRAAMMLVLSQRGHEGMSSQLQKFSCSFAKWRWGTLTECCVQVSGIAAIKELLSA